jgi:hypothetical protein
MTFGFSQVTIDPCREQLKNEDIPTVFFRLLRVISGDTVYQSNHEKTLGLFQMENGGLSRKNETQDLDCKKLLLAEFLGNSKSYTKSTKFQNDYQLWKRGKESGLKDGNDKIHPEILDMARGASALRKISGSSDPNIQRTPADARTFLRIGLKDLIDIHTTVNFDAEISNQNPLTFKNNYYNKKNIIWKILYNIGPELSGEWIKYSEDWLKEL